MSGQRHIPPSLPPGEIPILPLDRRLGGPKPGLDSVETWKLLILPRLELEPPAVEPVSSRYND
jgi:hypothetical protein